jgi:hypothetical protein
MFNVEQNTAPHIVVKVTVSDAIEAQAHEDQRQGLNATDLLTIMVGIALGAGLKGNTKLVLELVLADVEQLPPIVAVYGRELLGAPIQ